MDFLKNLIKKIRHRGGAPVYSASHRHSENLRRRRFEKVEDTFSWKLEAPEETFKDDFNELVTESPA